MLGFFSQSAFVKHWRGIIILVIRIQKFTIMVLVRAMQVFYSSMTVNFRWRSISMRAGLAFLQFDWSKARLSILPVFVYSHTKTGFKFFQDREDIGSFFFIVSSLRGWVMQLGLLYFVFTCKIITVSR